MSTDRPAALRTALELVLRPVAGASPADLDQAVLCMSCDGGDAGRARAGCQVPVDDCPRRCSCGGTHGAAGHGRTAV